MSFTSDLGNLTVIDDSNAANYAEYSSDMGFSRGYIERDFQKHRFGSYAAAYSGPVFPRSKWDDLIKMQEDNQSSPDHHRIASKVPILDQNGLPYCWMYGVVGAIMTCYAQTGMLVPHLSATGPAAQGKNWDEEGGWAGEAIEYIRKFGIPTMDVWPEHSMDRSLPKQESVKRSSALHGVVEFLELPSQKFDVAMSALLDPKNPRPVTLGLMWWGHLVYAAKAVKIDRNTYGMKIANSWKPTWEKEGCAVLSESKATAHEYVAIDRVTPKMAA